MIIKKHYFDWLDALFASFAILTTVVVLQYYQPFGHQIVIHIIVSAILSLASGILTIWTLRGAPRSNLDALDIVLSMGVVLAGAAFFSVAFKDTIPHSLWIFWPPAGPIAGFLCHLQMRAAV